MAITSLASLVAGLQTPVEFGKSSATGEAANVLHSVAYTAHTPAAAFTPGPGLVGASLTTYAGQLPFNNPITGNAYLATVEVCASVNGQFILYDRLWHNSGLIPTTLTAQTINSTAWPARDRVGTTDGDAVRVALEVSASTTNAGAIANTTMSYTNSAGVAGKTATMTSFPATAQAGTFIPFELAAGDTGIRSVQTVTLGTSYVAGTLHLVAYRVLAMLPTVAASTPALKDYAALGLPRLYNNTVPFMLWRPSQLQAGPFYGQITYAHG